MFGVADEGARGLMGVSFVEDGLCKEEAASGRAARIWEAPTGGDVGIRLLILSGEVFDSGKKRFTSGPSLSSAGAFAVYLWTGGTSLSKPEVSGGEEGLVGGSEPAVEVNVEDSITTGNAVVRGLKERVAS